MKQGIHPNYVDCTITCACGNVIKTRSTKPEIHVEVCSKCHPFYTGKQKLVDTGGRVVTFITPDGARELPLMSKDDVADAILDEILKRRK